MVAVAAHESLNILQPIKLIIIKVMEVAVGVVIGVVISVLMSFLALYLTKRLGMEEQRLLYDLRQENQNNILLTEIAEQLRTLEDTARATVPPRSRAQ